MLEPGRRQLKPSLLGCAMMILDDECPPEAGSQLCKTEDVDDGTACKRCWRAYVHYVANGRKSTRYQHNQHRNHQKQQSEHQSQQKNR